MTRVLFSFFLLLSLNNRLIAADIYWTATSSSNWNNPNNWATSGGLGASCSCLPTSSDRVIFLSGAANCNLDIDVAISDVLFQGGFVSELNLGAHLLTIGTSTTRIANALTITGQTISGSGTLSIYSGNHVTINNSTFNPNLLVDLSVNSFNTFTSGQASVFNGNVTVQAPKILLNGSTYNALTTFTKTGSATIDSGSGGNVFNGKTSITNKGANSMVLSTLNGDIFNADLELFINSNSINAAIDLAYGVGTTSYFNNVKISSVNNGTNIVGISFGKGGGNSQLSDGSTISENTPEFARGSLDIRNLTQIGNKAQTLDLTNTGPASASALRLLISNSTFNGNVSFTASTFRFDGNTFNGTSIFKKAMGGGSDAQIAENTWAGGNTFVGEAIINNATTSSIVLAGTKGDIFKGNATFTSNLSTGNFHIASADTSYFAGDIIYSYLSNSASTRIFGKNGGIVTFNGIGNQTIRAVFSGIVYTLSPIIPKLKVNKPSGNLVLSYPLQISTELILKSGNIVTNEANIVWVLEAATSSGGNNKSYVDGQVTKRGSDSFIFPVGSEGFYRPIGISAPSSASTFTAQYKKKNHEFGAKTAEGIEEVSSCEYWDLQRVSGGDAFVTLFWNQSTYCNENYITKPDHLRVLHWNGELWENMGMEQSNGDEKSGQLTSSVRASSFSPFTLGSSSLENELPIELTYFKAFLVNNNVKLEWETASELNNDYFTIERSKDGIYFETIQTIIGAGTSYSKNTYHSEDLSPLSGKSFYRLKQTDFDNKETFSEIVLIQKESTILFYPNPVKRHLHLKLEDQNQQILVKDLRGNTIFSGSNVDTIDTEDWTTGIYILEIHNQNTTESFRFTKIME